MFLDIRYLFVIQGNGSIVSGWKQAGQDIGTAVVSSVLTMGMVTVTKHNVSFLDSYAALVDLQTVEVLWSNSLRMEGWNPANPSAFKKFQWAHHVLYWLPPKGQIEPIGNQKSQ